MKPDARTKAWLLEQGATPWRTEVWHSFAHKKYDLFWIADYVALWPESPGVAGYQVCGEDIAPHLKDLLEDPNKAPMLKLWLSCRNPFEVHSWVKRGKQGKRKLWELRRWKTILSPEGQVSFEKVEE